MHIFNSSVITSTSGWKVFFSTIDGFSEIPGLLEGSNLLNRHDSIESVVGRKEKISDLIRLYLLKSLKQVTIIVIGQRIRASRCK